MFVYRAIGSNGAISFQRLVVCGAQQQRHGCEMSDKVPRNKLVAAFRSLFRDTDWQDAPFSNQMRRRLNGEWQYRPKTPDEERDYESRSAW